MISLYNHLRQVYTVVVVQSKQFFLDQRVVAGLGNIYVSEILHRSGISPTKTAAEVAGKSQRIVAAVERIHKFTNEVIFEAIEVGGSTISDFRGVDGSGDLGYFPQQFMAFNREGKLQAGKLWRHNSTYRSIRALDILLSKVSEIITT